MSTDKSTEKKPSLRGRIIIALIVLITLAIAGAQLLHPDGIRGFIRDLII